MDVSANIHTILFSTAATNKVMFNSLTHLPSLKGAPKCETTKAVKLKHGGAGGRVKEWFVRRP